MKLTKNELSLIVGCVSGYTVAKTIGEGFKAYGGKTGLIGKVARLITKTAFGTVAAGCTITFAERVYDLTKRVYDTYAAKMEHEPEKSWVTGVPEESGLVSMSEFEDLRTSILCAAGNLYYYVGDQMLLDEDDRPVDRPDIVEAIKNNLPDENDKGSLYYFDRYRYPDKYYNYHLGIIYEILVLHGSFGKDYVYEKEEKGGESK